ALRVGKSELAESLEVLYRRSHSDSRLRHLMLAVLRQKRHRVKSTSMRKSRNSLGLRLPYVKNKNIATHTFTTQASLEFRSFLEDRVGLLGTCRQIRVEASPVFYHDSTRFEAAINGDITEPVVGWFRSIGVQNCQRLRCVSLRHELQEKDKSEHRRNNDIPLSGSDIGPLYMAQEILAQPLVKALAICGVPAGSISTPESIPATYTKLQKLEFLTSLTDAHWGQEISKAIAAQSTAFKTQST
ncbi:hypothetical protein HII31_11700, partial [Pseudocercospora fuligena]